MIRIVSRWPSIGTLPGSTTLSVFFRRTVSEGFSTRVASRADCLASWSAILL